jgi:hypothetical protein
VRSKKELRDVHFWNDLKGLMSAEDQRAKKELAIKLADKLQSTYLADLPFVEAYKNLNLILRTLLKMGVAIQGAGELVEVMEVFNHLIDSFFIRSDIGDTERIALQKEGIMSFAYEERNIDTDKEYMEIAAGVAAAMKNYHATKVMRDQAVQKCEHAHDALKELAPELREMADQFASEMRQHRRYTLKSSYYSDELTRDPDQVWVMTDPYDRVAKRNPERKYAYIYSAKKGDILQEIRVQSKKVLDVDKPAVKNLRTGVVYTVSEMPFETVGTLELLKNGEIVFPLLNHDASVRDVFRRSDNEAEYELFRIFFLARAHGLTVPASLTRDMPSVDALASALHADRPLTAEELRVQIRKVILPRRLLSQQHGIVDAEARREEEGAEDEKRHSPIEHPVVGFKRDLPAGHHPTPQAIELARKRGFELDPSGNVTFVVPHRRGKGGAGVVHEQDVRDEGE